MREVKEWWQEEDVRFECQPDCGKCCTAESCGGRGVILWSSTDIDCLTEMDADELRDHLLPLTARLWVLKTTPRRQCLFLDGTRCQVYPDNPDQCSTYPFWPKIMQSRESWLKEGERCPGIGMGKVIAPEDIVLDLAVAATFEHKGNVLL